MGVSLKIHDSAFTKFFSTSREFGILADMKGNPKVIEELNKALREELTAINQYFLHAEMCENWGYRKLSEFIKKQSIGEMRHAESLLEIATEQKDNGSRDLLVVLLKDEESHVDWLEAQVHQIKEMGYERYLSMQTGEFKEGEA